ncbi:hypothetical protein ACIOG8_00170 [Streptomyces erythrochromogenes]|uniref:hypothetical protein n=1 Tax=Streptomyces erythrochromogenes TaxID=285574 RepID=UPI0038190167
MLKRVRTTYQHLTDPAVTADRPLSTATRQVVLAGSRGLIEDRLLNLITAAEAVFITRLGRRSRNGEKAVLLASGAAGRLTGDLTLGTPTSENIEALIRSVYRWRNAEVHGGQHRTDPFRRLDGTTTNDLATVAEDLDRMMRRALLPALEGARQTSGHLQRNATTPALPRGSRIRRQGAP